MVLSTKGENMKSKVRFMRTLLIMLLAFQVMILPVCAADNNISVCSSATPWFNNVINASLSIGFDMDNVVYCSIGVNPYPHGSGISGIMKLYDSSNTCLAVWSVSDYEGLFFQEFSYQGVYGETYTATFEGYAYSNNGTAPDRLEISVTDTCK